MAFNSAARHDLQRQPTLPAASPATELLFQARFVRPSEIWSVDEGAIQAHQLAALGSLKAEHETARSGHR